MGILYEAGGVANGVETSKIIIEAENLEEATKYLLNNANIYCYESETQDISYHDHVDDYIKLT